MLAIGAIGWGWVKAEIVRKKVLRNRAKDTVFYAVEVGGGGVGQWRQLGESKGRGFTEVPNRGIRITCIRIHSTAKSHNRNSCFAVAVVWLGFCNLFRLSVKDSLT